MKKLLFIFVMFFPIFAYALNTADYKDSKGNTLEHTFYSLTKQGDKYIRLIPHFDDYKGEVRNEVTYTFKGSSLIQTNYMITFEYEIKKLNVKNDIFYVTIEGNEEGDIVTHTLEIKYIDEDKAVITTNYGSEDIVTNMPDKYEFFEEKN